MKRVLFIVSSLMFGMSLCACGGKGHTSDSAPASSNGPTGLGSASDPGDASADSCTEQSVPDQVMIHNHLTGVLGIYDMALYEEGCTLDDLSVWSCDVPEGGADARYREDTVFGDVIVVTKSGAAAIYSYPEGKLLWRTGDPGNNSHSIEILPGGNVIVANSTGATLRLFKTSALTSGDTEIAARYTEYPLDGAHGVLWDPEYQVLWALGNTELAAYALSGEGTDQTLVKVNGQGIKLPSDSLWGHDLSADLTNTEYLWLTTGYDVFRFNKENNELIEKYPQYGKLDRGNVKGFSNTPNGTYFFCYPNFGPGTSWEKENYADWCTDRVSYAYMKSENFMYVQEIPFEEGAFYKVRTFWGKYQ